MPEQWRSGQGIIDRACRERCRSAVPKKMWIDGMTKQPFGQKDEPQIYGMCAKWTAFESKPEEGCIGRALGEEGGPDPVDISLQVRLDSGWDIEQERLSGFGLGTRDVDLPFAADV